MIFRKKSRSLPGNPKSNGMSGVKNKLRKSDEMIWKKNDVGKPKKRYNTIIKIPASHRNNYMG